MHLLDLFMYFICFVIISKILGEEHTNEIGGIVIGFPIMIIFTVAYIYLFVYIDYNWSDIFSHFFTNLKL
jgi:hypothetical protein